jgi:hypothetical protein
MLVKINNRIIETQNVTYIIDREIHMNNGKSFTLLEPEIQALLAAMFEEPRPVRLCIEEPTPKETMVMPEQVTKSIKKVLKKK